MMVERSPGSIFAALAADLAQSATRLLARRKNRQLAIHAARKSIRRLRSVLDLCREAFGPEIKGIDRQYKQIAASLSTLRDAHVVANTATSLAKAEGNGPWHEVSVQLQRRRNTLMAKVLTTDPDFGERRASLHALADAVGAMPWNNLSIDHLRNGITRSVRRVAKAEQASAAAPSLAHRHRWRRRLRRLRMQLQAIQTANKAAPELKILRPSIGNSSIKALSKRSDELGRLQDLHMLRRSLKSLDQSFPLATLRNHVRAEMKRAST
jgi:CHAD domain-containing protein